jgi:hypothetical protein
MADPLKQWADNKLGNAPAAKGAPPPPGAKASAVAPVQPPPGAAPQRTKTPDVRAGQMTWLGAEQQQELKGHEPEPPPSWIDPMQWATVKAQMDDEWNALPEPRASAAFLVHQTQQAAKASEMPPPDAPAAPKLFGGQR